MFYRMAIVKCYLYDIQQMIMFTFSSYLLQEILTKSDVHISCFIFTWYPFGQSEYAEGEG